MEDTPESDTMINSEETTVLENYLRHLAVYNQTWNEKDSISSSSSSIKNSEIVSTVVKKMSANGKDMLGLPPSPQLHFEMDQMVSPDCPFILTQNEVFGRHMVASKRLHAGQVVLIEPPLIMAPLNQIPYCLNCLAETTTNFTCPDCGFFLCNPDCKMELHNAECGDLSKLGLGNEPENFKRLQGNEMNERILLLPEDQRQQAVEVLNRARESALQSRKKELMQYYALLAVVRTIIAMERSSSVMNVIKALQAHIEPNARQYLVNQKHIIKPIISKIWENRTSDEIHRLAAVWDTNSFEVSLGWGSKVQGLYPGATLISHSCRSNLQQWFTEDGIMVMRAIDDIPKGDILTICYSEPLWPTRLRLDHLSLTKHFLCSCSRCTDPTELGTYMGSLKCPDCSSPLLPDNPVDISSAWHCQESCAKTMTAKEVATTDSNLAPILRQASGAHSKDLKLKERLIMKLSEYLHPHHHLIIRMHLATINETVKCDYKDLPDDELDSVIQSTEEVIDVLRVTEAPLSSKRARVGREYVRSRLEKLHRESLNYSAEQIGSQLQELQQQLQESQMCLNWDDRMPDMTETIRVYQYLSSL